MDEGLRAKLLAMEAEDLRVRGELEAAGEIPAWQRPRAGGSACSTSDAMAARAVGWR